MVKQNLGNRIDVGADDLLSVTNEGAQQLDGVFFLFCLVERFTLPILV